MIIISKAKNKDIPGIMDVQYDSLFEIRKKKNELNLGFLVYPFEKKELKDIITSDQSILLVAKIHESNKIVGYILAYDYDFWKQLKSEWESNLEIPLLWKRRFSKTKTLYLRHIARLKKFDGVGSKLLKQLIELVSLNYNYILCEILDKPVKNVTSIKFFEKFNFNKIGHIIYKDNFEWNIYVKNLSKNSLKP